jgi:hypothetical protein
LVFFRISIPDGFRIKKTFPVSRKGLFYLGLAEKQKSNGPGFSRRESIPIAK